MNKELRTFGGEVRMMDGPEDKPRPVVGYGAVFNRQSENLGGFFEMIVPGAFDDVLTNDVRALFNHDPNYILGRTTAGTLRLNSDSQGLRYEFDAPETRTIQDLVIAPILRGDINQSSFGFFVAEDGDEWEAKDGMYYRTIYKIDRLFDVSPVTFPAYPDASVGARSLEKFKEAELAKQKHLDQIIVEQRTRDTLIRGLQINI